VLGIALAAALPGCGSSKELPPAAEPAESPPADERPAGRVVELGAQAEGVVADGAPSGLVAVGLRDPDALALVDGQSGVVVRRVALPESPRHLALAPGGPVLVPAERANALVRVTLPDGATEANEVGEFPHNVAAGAGRIFTVNEFGDSLSVIEDGRVVKTVETPVQPGGVAVLDRLVGVVTVRSNALTLYDSRTLERLGGVTAGAGPTHVVAGPRHRFYVVDTRGDALLVVDAGDGVGAGREPVVVRRTNLAGTPYGVAIDKRRDRLWVTLTERNEVVELALSDAAPEAVRTYPTVRQPNTVAVDPATGRVYVAGRANGELQLIDPGAGASPDSG